MPAMMMIRLTTMARTGRRKNRSVKRISVVFRLGAQLGIGLDGIVDHDRRIVAQLECASGDQFLAVGHAIENCHVITTRLPEPHELLTGILDRLAGWRGPSAGSVRLLV